MLTLFYVRTLPGRYREFGSQTRSIGCGLYVTKRVAVIWKDTQQILETFWRIRIHKMRRWMGAISYKKGVALVRSVRIAIVTLESSRKASSIVITWGCSSSNYFERVNRNWRSRAKVEVIRKRTSPWDFKANLILFKCLPISYTGRWSQRAGLDLSSFQFVN
jgi:hypothetical protein